MAQQTIKVNTKVKANFRPNSARALYYAAICSHNGKSVNAFAKHCAANPPSVPQRGKLKGKQEPVTGWVSYFVRNGYITLVGS
jgi:hypothetical protein